MTVEPLVAKPFRTRSRTSRRPISAREAQRRSDELFANAETMPQGPARQSIIEKARTFRWLAEIKRLVSNSGGS